MPQFSIVGHPFPPQKELLWNARFPNPRDKASDFPSPLLCIMGYRASRFPDAGTPRHDVFRRLCFGWLISCHVKPVFYAADDKMGLDVIISLSPPPPAATTGWLALPC